MSVSAISGPRPLPERVDVFIAGAGTAGAAAAGSAAALGLRVLCVDRALLDSSGAFWLNGVSREAFARADVALPEGDELRGSDSAFHMIAGYGPERLLVRDHGVLDVDMRLLVQRLQARARDAGATLEGVVEVRGIDGDRVLTSRGTVRADVIVDASGLTGARLLGQPRTPARDLCAAAQAVYEVDDAAGASAFLERHGAAEGEPLCFTGVSGGYSILNVRVHHGQVAILTGSIPADGHLAGRPMIERFVRDEAWIGRLVSGGRRAIPLGRPHDVLARGRIAAIGDAARQVFSAHGSGIGAGMEAGHLLAQTIAAGRSPNDYAADWMRRRGALFAGYDLFRRFSQGLDLSSLRKLMGAGLIDPESAAAALGQRFPRVSPLRALEMGPALGRLGPLLPGLARLGARMAALGALYRAYPRDPTSRRAWARRVQRVCGA